MNTAIVEFNEFEKNLAEYKARYEGVIYDFTEAAQEKQAKSDRLAIGKTIAELDRAHRAVKEPLKAQVDVLDHERKRIKDGLLSVQGDIKSQIAQHEEKLQAVEDELEARVQKIKDLAIFEFGDTPDSMRLGALLNDAEAIQIDDSFAHHEANAALAKTKSVEMLKSMLETALALEAQTAENERLKAELSKKEQAIRDEQIANEARATAEREALEAKARAARAEADAAADVAAAAERERIAGIRAEEAAKAAAIQAEIDKKVAVERAEQEAQERQAEEQARELLAKQQREADIEHKRKVNRETASFMCASSDITMMQARDIITAIASRKIPHITINY